MLANRYGVDGFLEGEVTRLGLYSARRATLSVVVLESVASEQEQARLLEVLLAAR